MSSIMLERSGIVKHYFGYQRTFFQRREPLPSDLVKRYIQRPHMAVRERAKSMTIAAGFRCSDGVVLCADTQMTLGPAKFQESKIICDNTLKCRPVFTYSGDRDFSNMAIEMIIDAISSAEQNGNPPIAALRKILREIHDDYCSLPVPAGEDPYVFQGLGCLYISGRRRLFSISGPSIGKVEECSIIGIGKFLGSHVAQLTFDSNLRIKQAIHAAAYLLFCAKRSSPYCGGRSQIMMLSDHRGKLRWLSNDAYGVMPETELESNFEIIHRELRDILVGFGDLEVSRETFKLSLEKFCQNLTEMREPHLKEIENFYAQAFADSDQPMSDEEPMRTADEMTKEETDDES